MNFFCFSSVSTSYIILASVAARSAASVALNRAIRIIDFAVNVQARANDWRLSECYDTSWKPLLDYNRDQDVECRWS